MPVLICEKCNVYYELNNKSEAKGFGDCKCGNDLVYFDSLDGYYAAYEESNENFEREHIVNGLTYTEKQVIKYKHQQKTAKYKNNMNLMDIFTFISIGFFIIGILLIILPNAIELQFFGIIITVLCGFYFFERIMSVGGSGKSVYRSKNNKSLRKDGLSWVKGLEGENLVLSYLKTLPDTYTICHDVKLPYEHGNIDHIVIGPNGVFLIETKNYRGKWRIQGEKWYYYKNGRYNSARYDPTAQVVRNESDFEKFLWDRGISSLDIALRSIVALVCSNHRIVKKPHSYEVLIPENLHYVISTYKGKPNAHVLKKVILELKPYCTEIMFARK